MSRSTCGQRAHLPAPGGASADEICAACRPQPLPQARATPPPLARPPCTHTAYGSRGRRCKRSSCTRAPHGGRPRCASPAPCPDPCDPLAALARAPCQAIIATAWRGQVHRFWPAQRTLTVTVLALHGRGRSTLLGKLPRELLLAEVLPRALSAPRHSWRPLPSPATTWRPPLAPLRAARRAAPAAPAEQAAAPAPWLAPTFRVYCLPCAE